MVRKLSTLFIPVLLAAALAGCHHTDQDKNKSSQPAANGNASANGARPSNPGVTDNEILVGMNAAFSGPSVGLGVEYWRGAKLAFDEINAKGGVAGRKIRMVLADDGYDAERAAPAILKLITQSNVFCTGWSVGTPTIVKTLPVILQYYQSEHLFHFGCFTGAQPQRNPPYRKAVFNLRASYRQETAAMVDAFYAMGKRKIGTFVQNDAYGTDGREGTVLALKSHGLSLVADQRYERGQKYQEDYSAQMKALKAAGVDAIIMVGSYQACGGAIRDARKMGWNVPIHNVSFVGAEQMLTFLKRDMATVPNILSNLIVTQVVPHYDDTTLPAVRQYRAAMDQYDPGVPQMAQSSAYRPSGKYSFGSLEGYLTGQVFIRVLQKVGHNLTREAFIHTAETEMGAPAAVAGQPGTAAPAQPGAAPVAAAPPTMPPGSFDIGVGQPASFSATDHQALNTVWFTYATPTGWKPTNDVSTVIH